jgi:hypothetical protein
MENDEAVQNAKNLTIALSILDSYWDKLSPSLTVEERKLLTSEIARLEPKIRESGSITQTSEEAARFFNVFQQIEPLSFLSDLDNTLKRGASLNSPEDEVKIKILNYCITLKDKIDDE